MVRYALTFFAALLLSSCAALAPAGKPKLTASCGSSITDFTGKTYGAQCEIGVKIPIR